MTEPHRPQDSELTHLDHAGRARMVDVGDKPSTERHAEARASIELTADVCDRLWRGDLPKGEALPVARIAGIQAAKETSRLIPLCHSLALSSVEVDFTRSSANTIEVRARARCVGPTGVEMEAMVAVSVAALTIYDMCKALCRAARIGSVELLAKSGGRSGAWRRDEV